MPVIDNGGMKKAPRPDKAPFCWLIVWGMTKLCSCFDSKRERRTLMESQEENMTG